MMKKAPNILDYFNVQTKVSCPACGVSLMKSKLNEHLDILCSSALENKVASRIALKSSPNKSNTRKLEAKTKKVIVSNRLSRRKPKRINDTESGSSLRKAKFFERSAENCFSQNGEDDNVMILKVNESNSNNVTTRIEQNTHNKNEVSLMCPNKVENSLSPNQTDNNDILSLVESGNIMEDKKLDSNELDVNKILQEDFKSKELQTSSDQNILVFNAHKISSSTADIAALLHDAEESLEADDNVFSESSNGTQNVSSQKNAVSYPPYYIANFLHILNAVLNDEQNKILFNEEDRSFIQNFETASIAAQKLYVRLFQRKYKWLRPSKMNYPEISKDLSVILEELVKLDLLDSGFDKIELQTGMELLSLPEAKNLLKQYNFTCSGKNKNEITEMLMKHCKEHKSVFFTNGKNSVSNMMLKKVRQVIGPCYRLSLLPKRLFTRIFMLFSLPTISEDDDDAAGGQQQQLLTLLQINKGELKFPEYKQTRETVIFIDRDDLIRYEEARQLENDILNAVENKNFELAKELYINAKDEFDEQCSSTFFNRAASMPAFLKKYTSFHIYMRCMTQGVEVLQRLRQYDEAVSLLRRLLKQQIFCLDYHGRWFDRLALNLEQHLKKPKEALEAIKQGLKDKNVRVGHRYSLLVRALRIIKNDDENSKFKKNILKESNIIDAPKVVIKGRLFPRPISGRRNVFISSNSTKGKEEDITVLGVEQLAIEHYKNEGFSEGIHGEGTTFHALYGLLFWDIIYDGSIPDAFISPYQTHPLDLNSDFFFGNRERQILSQLEYLKSCTIKELKEIVKVTWDAHYGQSSLVMWDRFSDVEHIQGLVSCLRNNIICGICERLARDFRFTRSGVPDLVVWNPETLSVKIVEVKGPGDKLSSKQILWLDYLIKLGADAEVCLIEAVGSKKLRKE